MINLAPEEIKPPLINLDTGEGPRYVSPETAEARGTKAGFSLSELMPERGSADYTAAINNGQENSLRAEVAAKVDQKNQKELQDKIMKLAPVPGSQAEILSSITNHKPTDPHSSLEVQYGKQFAHDAVFGSANITASPGGWFKDLTATNPQLVQQGIKGLENVAKYREFAVNQLQDATQAYKDQSTGGAFVDFMKDFSTLGGYSELKLRNQLPGEVDDARGFGLGQYLDDLAKTVKRLPFDQYTQVLTEIKERLVKDNPALAVKFFHAIVGQSTDETVLDNAFTAMTAQGIGAVGSAVTVGLLKGALKDVAKALPDADKAAIRPVIAEAAGAPVDAAISKVTPQIVQRMIGGTSANPTKEAVEALPAMLKTIDKRIAEGGSNVFSRDVVNRISEGQGFIQGIMDRIENYVKVERIPGFLASEKAVKDYYNEIKGLYPGMRNSLAEFGDVVRNLATNEHYIPMYFRRFDGNLFGSFTEAKNFAKLHPRLGTEVTETLTEGGATGFKTSKGSTYEIKADGTTIRNKARRDEPGHVSVDAAGNKVYNEGIMPQSRKTVYLTQEDANKIAPTQGNWKLVDHGDGTISLATPTAGKKVTGYGIPVGARNIPFETTPKPGLIPLELFSKGKLQGVDAYKDAHFGNLITDLTYPTKTSVEGYKIRSKGFGFYIEKLQPVNETSFTVRNAIGTKPPEQTTRTGFLGRFENPNMDELPESWHGLFSSWGRTSDETTTRELNMARKTATYVPSGFLKFVKEYAEGDIRDAAAPLRGKNFYDVWQNRGKGTQFLDTLKSERDMLDPDTGKKGYFFKTLPELEAHFQTHYQRFPDPIEAEAYFKMVRVVEMDRTFRNIAMHRYMSRVGAEMHSFNTFPISETGEKIKTPSPYFSGVIRKEFPRGGEDLVLVADPSPANFKYINVNHVNTKEVDLYNEQIKSGKKNLIEVYDPEQKPLIGWGGVENDRIRYILTDNVTTRPLPYDLVPRRGGGHIEYDYPAYIKQPIIDPQSRGGSFHHWYLGDATLMPMQSEAQARIIADKFTQARKLMKAGDEPGAIAVLRETGVPPDEAVSWFKPSRGPKGEKLPPRFSGEHDFYVVPKNKQIIDLNKDLENTFLNPLTGKTTFRDGTREGSLARQYQVGYTQERDAYEMFTVKDEGTWKNPVWKYEPADKIDPIPMMNRSLTRITNSNYLDDYKMAAVDNWLKAARDHLDASVPEINGSPMHYFNHGTFKAAVGRDVRWPLEAERIKIQQLLGTPSVVDTELQRYAQKLADTIYTNKGPGQNVVDRTVLLTPPWLISQISNVSQIARSATFHSTMGFFTPVQILVQNMGFATFGSISPRYAMTGTHATILHQLSRMNGTPEWLAYLDNMATKFNAFGVKWKPGEWTQARNDMFKANHENVGQEHTLIDYTNAPRTISTVGGDFLDGGQFFFKGSERNIHFGSWYTAWKEIKDVNPGKVMDNAMLNQVLDRADLFGGNMSRASKTILENGTLSWPTMFLSYQLRLAEAFLGKRLTLPEKARLFTGFSVIFGLPVGMGLAAFPFGDLFRKYSIDNGYVVGENFMKDTIMNGLPAAIGALALGGAHNPSNWLNFGTRFGTPGIDVIREAMMGDKSFLEIMTGAPGGKIKGFWGATDGFRQAMMSWLRGDKESFPMTGQDLADPLKEISTLGIIDKTLVAVNTGRWLSKNETLIEKVDPVKAVIMGLTGLQPQGLSDAKLKMWTMKSEQDAQKQGLQQFLQEYRRYLLALEAKDNDQAKTYFVRAKAWLIATGYPDEKWGQALSIGAEQNKTLIERIDWNYYNKNVPADRQKAAEEAFRTQTILNSRKGQ